MGKSRDLITRSTLEMLILALMINGSELHGYDILMKINEHTSGIKKLAIGSIYPTLYGLRDQGYLTEHRGYTNLRARVNYKITETGSEYFYHLVKNHYHLGNIIDNILVENGVSKSELIGGDHFERTE